MSANNGLRGEAQQHVDATVRTWLGIRDGGIHTPLLPEPLARLLLRVEEHEQHHRDQWDCWEYGFSENFRNGKLWIPEVDEWTAVQRRDLLARTELEPLWPHDASFALCLTHDVDMISRHASPAQMLRGVRLALASLPTGPNGLPHKALRTARAIARSAYFGVSRTPTTSETLGRSVEIEREYGVKSTYFFTVYPSRPTPYDCTYGVHDPCLFRNTRTSVADVMRWLAREGWDVGLHGSYLSAVEPELLAQEKATLEEAVGRPVTTVRQHYLHFDVRTTPLLQQQAGLAADSTLGFNRSIGFRSGTSLPFRLFDFSTDAPVNVLEVPLVIQESPLLASNALELDVHLAKRTIAQLFERIADVGGVATILFHPHSLRDPGFVSLYRYAIECGIDLGAWIASLAEIVEWWQRREERLLLSQASVPASDHRA